MLTPRPEPSSPAGAWMSAYWMEGLAVVLLLLCLAKTALTGGWGDSLRPLLLAALAFLGVVASDIVGTVHLSPSHFHFSDHAIQWISLIALVVLTGRILFFG